MAMNAQDIADLIQSGIPDAKVRIEDLRGDGEHYAAHVMAETFRGLPRVKQHQMVYQALQGKMGRELHALAIHTSVPNA
jgi:stress-induced morphogen